MKRYKILHHGISIESDGEWVRYSDHVEAMKRIAGASAQHAEPAVVRKTFVFDGVRNPDFVPLRIEFEPGYPEDVAFGTQRQMDRLKKWLDKFFAMRTAQSASPAARTDEQRKELELIARADPSWLIKYLKENTVFDIPVIEKVFALAKEHAAGLLAAPRAGLTDYSYQQLFDAISAATKVTSGTEHIAISVAAFRSALLAASPADQVPCGMICERGQQNGKACGIDCERDIERDAARYRWLRESDRLGDDELDGHIVTGAAGCEDLLWGERMDSAIDAAMSKGDANG